MIMTKFSEKVAFITGAGTGIGRAAALAFAREGAKVIATGLSDKNVQETANLVKKSGGTALPINCDVTNEEEIISALDQTIKTFGRLDFAFNNAGIEQPLKPVIDITLKEWDQLLAVNLKGVFLCMKHQIPLLLKQGGGVIVNTSSGAGVKGFRGQAAYAATKHGLIGLTKSAALDYADANIRINAVCPGIIETPMMDRFTEGTNEGRQRVIAQEPVGRMGKPEEIAETVIWLCSDAGAFTVGAAIVVDGGQTI
ncbi:Levodione reductase [Legionella bozemanae]|uniref:Acetyoacetyl CoA reductase n=2 Tax=Legionella bozemanae TaxID=447 RepID=A0A0W0S2U4_LEGBO|nr:acetyoacetyl CoA reductase [Legionella bozemanae]STO32867.1 Levodione reductase [Legionella bozemanae]